MRRLRKLTTTLSLIAVAAVGVCLAPQTARANCIAPIQIVNMETGEVHNGFLSCGSSAGNYIANTTLGTTGDEDIANILCDFGFCPSAFLDNKAKGVRLEICSAAPSVAPRPAVPLKTKARS